jgi:hypothetical protein
MRSLYVSDVFNCTHFMIIAHSLEFWLLQAENFSVLSVANVDADRACMPGYARCADNRCVMVDFVCDGVAQCRDGSDESNCKDQVSFFTTVIVHWCPRYSLYLS